MTLARSSSALEPPGKPKSPVSGKDAGSPEESNFETQKPNDAFFMCRLELQTSLWKKRMATITFLPRGTTG